MAREEPLGAEEEIRRRIAERGAIPFVEFMEIALFWPRGGYYGSPERVGPQGDYYTSPAAHPVFGALLSLQLFQMWELLGRPAPFYVVELGAGGGVLARDILEHARSLPAGLSRALRYLCVDRVPGWGVEGALRYGSDLYVGRLAAVDLPFKGLVACVLSNELVDSFPVHRLEVRDGELCEVYVALESGGFRETLGKPSTPRLQERLDRLGVSLPEGYRSEINLAVDGWAQDVAVALERGFVLTVDYGYAAEEYYSPRRHRGTLTCFYKHMQVEEPCARIGQQDITAHVEFTSLMHAGERAGLETLAFVNQHQFLHNLGLQRYLHRLRDMDLPLREAAANRFGMLELVRPDGLGRFKVLVQGKGVTGCGLWGAVGGTPIFDTPVPLLTSRHAPLLAGRYPDELSDWEHLWPGKAGEGS